MTAQEALDMGLVNTVVPVAELGGRNSFMGTGNAAALTRWDFDSWSWSKWGG
jgi:enoyl-CoA hydratase/carnithine racemase